MRTKKITFQQSDLVEFSKLSGDLNPLHLNQEYASRTKFRKPIVYGIHSFISALNILHKQKVLLSTLKLSFLSPIYIGQELTASLEQNFNKCTLSLWFGNRKLIRASYTLNSNRSSQTLCRYRTTHGAIASTFRDIGEVKLGELFKENIYLLESFRNNSSIFESCLNEVQLAILYSCSRITGIRVAGGNSVLSSLQLNFGIIDTADQIRVVVNMVSYGTRMIEIGLEIGPKLTLGTILSQVLEPRPIARATMTIPENNVQSFSGKTTLITGASRGIGAGVDESREFYYFQF